MFRGISQDINPLAGVFSDRFVDSLNTISRKNLVVDCLLCPAVCLSLIHIYGTTIFEHVVLEIKE